MFSVKWATELIMEKYKYPIKLKKKNVTISEYFYEIAKGSWLQLREEREVFIFIQDVFLGKYSSMKDETMEYWIKLSKDYIHKFIKDGKSRGYIRKDIDDNIICTFMIGANMKFKEYILNRARIEGESIIDEDLEKYDNEIKGFIELMENGMMPK